MEPAQETATYVARIEEHIANVSKSTPEVGERLLNDEHLARVLRYPGQMLPTHNNNPNDISSLPFLGYERNIDDDAIHQAYWDDCAKVNAAMTALHTTDIHQLIKALKGELPHITNQVLGGMHTEEGFLQKHDEAVQAYPLLSVGGRVYGTHGHSVYILKSGTLHQNGIPIPLSGRAKHLDVSALREAYTQHLKNTMHLLDRAPIELALLATQNTHRPDLYQTTYVEVNPGVAHEIIAEANETLCPRSVEIAECLDNALNTLKTGVNKKVADVGIRKLDELLAEEARTINYKIQTADATYQLLECNVEIMHKVMTWANKGRDE